jgi:Rap1a immunity proteins
MKVALPLSVLIFLLAFNFERSFAGVLETGSDLRDACGAIPPTANLDSLVPTQAVKSTLDSLTPMQGVKSMSCVGYISGVVDAWLLAGKPLCAPLKTSRSEAALIVDKHIDEHPEELHLSPAVLVLRAMNHAWLCK